MEVSMIKLKKVVLMFGVVTAVHCNANDQRAFLSCDNILDLNANGSDETSKTSLSYKVPDRLRDDIGNVDTKCLKKEGPCKGRVRTTNSKNFKLPTASALTKQKSPRRASKGEVVEKMLKTPRSSKPLNEHSGVGLAFADIIDNPIKTNISIMFDGDGKTHAYLLSTFAAKIEEKIGTQLCKCADYFIGCGSGAIPAAYCAYSKEPVSLMLDNVINLPSKQLISRAEFIGFKFVEFFGIVKDAAMSYLGNGEINDSLRQGASGLSYDKINLENEGAILERIFNESTTDQLNVPLLVISSEDSDTLSKLVYKSIKFRNQEARAKVAKTANLEVLRLIEDVISIGDAAADSDLSSIVSATNSINLKVKKSIKEIDMKQNLNIASVQESLTRKGLDRIMINIIADTVATTPNDQIIVCCSSSVKCSEDLNKIISLNYRFTVPTSIYGLNTSKIKLATSNAMQRIFSCDEQTQNDVSCLTGLLTDFMTQYTSKTICNL